MQAVLEGIGATNTPWEEDMLFNEAVCTLVPPGTEDDHLMDESGSGLPVDLDEARRYLDADDVGEIEN